MTRAPSSADVTKLLQQWSRGDAAAADRLVPIVYQQLRRMASRQLRRERDEHTLSPTALVNELYLRLVDQRRMTWQNRAQFFGVAAQLMRRILVDHARARAAEKRGAGTMLIPLSDVEQEGRDQMITDVIDVDEALERLALVDPDQVRLVELRFFAGLSVDETALVLKRSPRTVKREWRLAKAWLHRELGRDAR
jgi:RNA polymerase sigma factor (TIGR02999 family)